MDQRKITLFLSNVSLPDDTIQQMLSECGDLHRWKRIIDPTGSPKQFGFAEFQRVEGASRALKLLPFVCPDLKVRIDPETSQIIARWHRQQREQCDGELRKQQVERDEQSQRLMQKILEPAQERQELSIEEQIRRQEEIIRGRESDIKQIVHIMQSFDSDSDISQSDIEQDNNNADSEPPIIPAIVIKPQSSSRPSIRTWVRQQIEHILTLQDSTLEDWIIKAHYESMLTPSEIESELQGLFQDHTQDFIHNLFTLFPLRAGAIED